MASRKEKIWKDTFDDLLQKHGIVFEGPTKPSRWPKNHKHTFRVVRDIWAMRYVENVQHDTPFREVLLRRQRKADDIAKVALQYHFGRKSEQSWTGVETDITGIFRKPAVCDLCKGERHKIGHEAQPMDDDAVAALERKRRHRKVCACSNDTSSNSARSEDDNGVQPVIFTTLQSMSMTHHPTDHLEHTDVPMQPDRTIGLSASYEWRHALRIGASNLVHSPMSKATDVLYPFLLIEAKRGVDVPGFAAIEAQTAFPIRRLLLQQDNLYRQAGTYHHALVWFFAYQGDVWRLYAGTLHKDEVRVYNLWHGTIESSDCTLQVLEIVDYIWSWARDVYRPQIRDSLSSLVPRLRDVSPLTNVTLSRSQSLLSEGRLDSPVVSQLDVVMEEHQPSEWLAFDTTVPAEHTRSHDLCQYGTQRPNYELHNFGRAELRHSDTIKFAFRVLNFPTHTDLSQYLGSEPEQGIMFDRFTTLFQSSTAVVLTQSQIYDLERFWLGGRTAALNTSVPTTTPPRQKAVQFYFRTFNDLDDWQIIRQMNCVVWDVDDLQQYGTVEQQEVLASAQITTHSVDIVVALLQLFFMVRDMTGHVSVSWALSKIGLTLSRVPVPHHDTNPICWTTDNSANITDIEGKFALTPHWGPPYYRTNTVINVLEHGMSGQGLSDFHQTPEEMGHKGGILVRRPRSWPAECPKFCLFVLRDIAASDRIRLRELLRRLTSESPIEIFGMVGDETDHLGRDFDQDEKTLIREWLRSYKG